KSVQWNWEVYVADGVICGARYLRPGALEAMGPSADFEGHYDRSDFAIKSISARKNPLALAPVMEAIFQHVFPEDVDEIVIWPVRMKSTEGTSRANLHDVVREVLIVNIFAKDIMPSFGMGGGGDAARYVFSPEGELQSIDSFICANANWKPRRQ